MRAAFPSILVALLGLSALAHSGCGDDDASTTVTDAGGGDAETPPDGGDDGGDDGGADGGPMDAGPPPLPEGVLATDVCPATEPGQQTVAVSAEGEFVAWVGCETDDPHVWGLSLDPEADPAPEPVALHPAEPTYSVHFATDGPHFRVGAGDTWWVARADGDAEVVRVAEGAVLDLEFIRAKVDDTEFGVRLVYLEEAEDGSRAVDVRADDDDFAMPTTLLEGPTVAASGNLDLISISGRTIVTTMETEEGTRAYFNLSTHAAEDPASLGIGPDEKVMAPIGIGDTHALFREEESLFRLKWKNRLQTILLAEGGITLENEAHLFVVEQGRGDKWVHFIQDGNPSRREREGMDPIKVLATAEATAQAATPDENTVVYLSGGTVYSVPSDASTEPVALFELGVETTSLVRAFRPDSTEVAVTSATGALLVALVGTTDAAVIAEETGTRGGSVGYAGDETTLVWLRDVVEPGDDAGDDAAELRVLAAGADDAATVASEVSGWWPIPDRADVLYLENDLLRIASVP